MAQVRALLPSVPFVSAVFSVLQAHSHSVRGLRPLSLQQVRPALHVCPCLHFPMLQCLLFTTAGSSRCARPCMFRCFTVPSACTVTCWSVSCC